MENGKHRSDFVACLCNKFSIVFPTDSGGAAEPAVARERERDRSGRTPIERCKLLLKASQLCAGGRAKIHSPQSGWMERALCSGVEGASEVCLVSLPLFALFHLLPFRIASRWQFIHRRCHRGRSLALSLRRSVDETQNCAVTFPLENESCGTAVRPSGLTVWWCGVLWHR